MTDEPMTPLPRSGQHLRANRDRSFDVALGIRIRAFRLAVDKSQGELGQAADISFQQVQKYELGKDRVAASTLFAFAVALNAPGAFFGGGLPAPIRSSGDVGATTKAAALFQEIGDHRVQTRLLDLAKVLGEDAGGGVGVSLKKGEA